MKKTGPVMGAGEIANKQQQISEAICTPSLPQDQVAIKRLIFELRLEAKAGAAGIHQLRALLKSLLRRHGFRCIDAREVRGRR